MDGLSVAMFIACLLASLIGLIGLLALVRQRETVRRLRSNSAIPSDERKYLSRQVRRRTILSVLLLTIAGMLASTFLLGIEDQANRLARIGEANVVATSSEASQPSAGTPREMTAEELAFLRFYSIYWVTIIGLLFAVLIISILDIVATRGYGMQQLRQIQQDHRTLMERDLAFYRQQRLNRRFATRRDTEDG